MMGAKNRPPTANFVADLPVDMAYLLDNWATGDLYQECLIFYCRLIARRSVAQEEDSLVGMALYGTSQDVFHAKPLITYFIPLFLRHV